MPHVTPALFVDSLICTLARESKFRPNVPVEMAVVEDAVLAETCDTLLDDKPLRRKIGLAFRAKREGYCGQAAPLTIQMGLGKWGLTPAGVERAYELAGTSTERLTILSMGLGRDSMTMMCLLAEGNLLAGGELLGPDDVDAIVFSDPGYEWKYTYDLIPLVQSFCDKHGIRFVVLAKPPAEGETGWREYLANRTFGERTTPPWVRAAEGGTIEAKAAAGYYHWRAPILHDYLRVRMITLRASAACTDQHKITPINGRFLNDLCQERFGFDNRQWSRRVGAGEARPHRVLIGIAADETDRIEKGAEAQAFKARRFVMPLHPLVEMGIAKTDEAPLLARHGFGAVRKSGCMGCHWQPDSHWWALSVVDPDTFAEYELMESEANVKRAEERKSLRFLRGSRPIREVVERWRERNPDADLEAVLNKEYGRGGCAARDLEAA